MKISKQELNKIILEELAKELEECGMPMPVGLEIGGAHGYAGGMHGETVNEPTMMGGETVNEPHMGEIEVDPDGYEGSMAKNNLRNASEDAMMLADMIQDEENLEPWVEEKIAVASSMLNSVARYFKGGRTG